MKCVLITIESNFYQQRLVECAKVIKRYFQILGYSIKLDKWYLLLRFLLTSIAFVSLSISLILPKLLLKAIANAEIKMLGEILLLSFFVSTTNSVADRLINPKLSQIGRAHV